MGFLDRLFGRAKETTDEVGDRTLTGGVMSACPRRVGDKTQDSAAQAWDKGTDAAGEAKSSLTDAGGDAPADAADSASETASDPTGSSPPAA